MSVRHYTHEELRVHLAAADPAITDHVESCEECREAFTFIEEFEAALADPMVWEAAEALQQPSGVRAEHLKAARLLQEEDRQATELLAPALVSIGAFVEHEVHVRARYRSAGVVRVLVREAKRVRDSSPKFAALIARASLTIASKLAAAVRPVVLGAAWLELGIAAAMLGQYRESEDALRHAEEAFEEGGNTWDLATVWLSRANVCVETERLSEASQLAVDAARAFASHGDTSRQLRSFLVSGAILYCRGLYLDAAAIYEQMLIASDDIDDAVTHARALHNAAHCYVSAGQLDRAADYLARAWVEWDALGFDAERVRTRWAQASIDLVSGNYARAKDGLEETRRQLAVLGLVNDEALVRLELAEALILLGQHSDVLPLLEGIAVHFANEGMMRKARMALASITEARGQVNLNAAALRRVRQFLFRLPMNPSEQFAPLK